MFEFDPHTHSIASGHGTSATITDLAKKAAFAGLKSIGITDHAPGTLCSGRTAYFRNLAYAPKKRCGIELLYGVELNIIDKDGNVDLADEVLDNLLLPAAGSLFLPYFPLPLPDGCRSLPVKIPHVPEASLPRICTPGCPL